MGNHRAGYQVLSRRVVVNNLGITMGFSRWFGTATRERMALLCVLYERIRGNRQPLFGGMELVLVYLPRILRSENIPTIRTIRRMTLTDQGTVTRDKQTVASDTITLIESRLLQKFS